MRGRPILLGFEGFEYKKPRRRDTWSKQAGVDIDWSYFGGHPKGQFSQSPRLIKTYLPISATAINIMAKSVPCIILFVAASLLFFLVSQASNSKATIFQQRQPLKIEKPLGIPNTCSYTVTIKTSCSSVPITRDNISLIIGDSYKNEVLFSISYYILIFFSCFVLTICLYTLNPIRLMRRE